MIGFGDVVAAGERISDLTVTTPFQYARSLSDAVERPVWLKGECFQRTGSFKVRGALNKVSQLAAGTEVVAASAGNHAQGVALAAETRGLRSTIWMPSDATFPKVVATRRYGAAVEFVAGPVDDAIAAAEEAAAERGAVYVHPFDDEAVIAGQGTLGLELADDLEDHDLDPEGVVVPVGGGGLLAGVSLALAGRRPGLPVYGVQAMGADAMARSLAAGRVVSLRKAETIADGIALSTCGELTFAHVSEHAAGVCTVSDEDIARAVVLLLERVKWVVEPAGAAPLAAVLAGSVPGDGPVVLVLSGGNVDPLLLVRIVEFGMVVEGRSLVLSASLPDSPGSLAGLLGAIADLGLNVVTVEHLQAAAGLPVNTKRVVVQLETRDPAQRALLVARLRELGYDADVSEP